MDRETYEAQKRFAGEKRVMRAAFERGYPVIVLKENGFTDLAKPNGKSMEACAEGKLLIMAPWEHHNEQIKIKREQCLKLNEMASIFDFKFGYENQKRKQDLPIRKYREAL